MSPKSRFKVYAQSGQFHTSVKSGVHLTEYQNYAPKHDHTNKLVLDSQMSNKRLQKKKSREKKVKSRLKRDVLCSRGSVE